MLIAMLAGALVGWLVRYFFGPQGDIGIFKLVPIFERELVGNLLRVKLWSPQGVVTYSTDAALIGEQTDDPAELRKPLSGQTVQQVTSLNEDGGRSSGEDAKAFESYVPVRAGESTRPAGVLEVYEAYAPVVADVRETVTPIGIALARTVPSTGHVAPVPVGGLIQH